MPSAGLTASLKPHRERLNLPITKNISIWNSDINPPTDCIMPPSQLKRLKASLREQGIVGPQKSKKQKKQNAQSGPDKEKRVRRSVALTGIREQFNPFEVKSSSRPPKFDVTSNKTIGGRVTKSVKQRPGVTKGLGEENVSYAPKSFHCLLTHLIATKDIVARIAESSQGWRYTG